MKKRFGPDKLAILSVKSRLAKLILIKAHREDHRRDPGETLFRSRSDAWIVRGRSLAEKVVKECGWCNRQDKRTLNQQMEDLPPQKFDIPCLPFNNICIDSAGPYQVKAMNNSRSKLKGIPLTMLNTVPCLLGRQISSTTVTTDCLGLKRVEKLKETGSDVDKLDDRMDK